jgi:hypothetical protein
MVRKYIRKNNSTLGTEIQLQNAISQLQGKSLRKVSTATGICKSTLHHYLKKLKASRDTPLKPLCHRNQILSTHQENELSDYLIQTQKEGYALTPKLLKELTFSYARYNGIKIPSSWLKNRCSGPDWFGNFMKRQPRLSLRKPEGTSIARASALNHPVMDNFYDQVEELYDKHSFRDDEVFIIDETNNPTVLESEKVIAETGTHQVVDLKHPQLMFIWLIVYDL